MPSFKNTALIFPEISFIQYFTIYSCKQYDVITDLICIIEKCQYLENEKRYFKTKKRHSSVFWKAFQISRKYFSCHMHFKPQTERLKAKGSAVCGGLRFSMRFILQIHSLCTTQIRGPADSQVDWMSKIRLWFLFSEVNIGHFFIIISFFQTGGQEVLASDVDGLFTTSV